MYTHQPNDSALRVSLSLRLARRRGGEGGQSKGRPGRRRQSMHANGTNSSCPVPVAHGGSRGPDGDQVASLGRRQSPCSAGVAPQRPGHSGNSGKSGRVIRVIKNSDTENCYPKFTRKKKYQEIRVRIYIAGGQCAWAGRTGALPPCRAGRWMPAGGGAGRWTTAAEVRVACGWHPAPAAGAVIRARRPARAVQARRMAGEGRGAGRWCGRLGHAAQPRRGGGLRGQSRRGRWPGGAQSGGWHERLGPAA
jgi:hypothetical protein